MKFVDNMRDEKSEKLHKLVSMGNTLDHWHDKFCPVCEFGIISYPASVRRCGVPFYVAKAMMQQFAAIVYCDCKHGDDLQRRDANTLAWLKKMRDTGVRNFGKDASWLSDAPDDYIPGAWWAAVREACE